MMSLENYSLARDLQSVFPDQGLSQFQKETHMQNRIRAILAMGLLSGTMAAHAATVNFNMSILSPSPSYDSVFLDLNLGALLGSGSVACQVFAGLGLTGGFVSGCAVPSGLTLTNAGVLDGVFSISWTQTGFVQDGMPFVVGVKNGIQTARLFADGTVEGGVIPEPATLALVGLALAGIGWGRRKPAP